MLFHLVIDLLKANIAFVSTKWNLIWLDNFSWMFGADLLLGITNMIVKGRFINLIVWEMGKNMFLAWKNTS